jgi:parvulin-like peptidyl-prolyl isomerase
MQQQSVFRRFIALFFIFTLLITACSDDKAQQQTGQASTSKAVDGDVIARVGDEEITFSQVNTMLNSSAVVGLSIPALGTPERDTVRITLLDKVVSANLIYLDAVKRGVDKDPAYQRRMQAFADAMLVDAYIRKQVVGDIEVNEAEIKAYYDQNIKAGTEMSDELRTVIEASIRKQKQAEKQAGLRDTLRKESKVTVYGTEIYPEGDAERGDDVVIASTETVTITWGEVKNRLIAAGKAAVKKDPTAMVSDARLQALQSEIDLRLLAEKARAAGLEQDPSFQARFNEYHKTSLINLHRANLARDMSPSDEELEAYFEANRDTIATPEYRKVQMVMLNSEEEARSVKQQVEAGEITLFQAAANHSVAPDARQNLGELGWVAQGTLKPELDAMVFALEPAEIGGPVQAGGLWHIAMVQDVRDAENTDISEARTNQLAKRSYIHDKLNDYVVKLRKDVFKVEVYEDTIIRLAQQEADMVRQMNEQSQEPGSVTKQRLEEMQKIFQSGEASPGT